MSDWWGFVLSVIGRDSYHEVGRQVGVSPSSVLRWQSSIPKADTVRAFALAYGVLVVDAMIAAGYLTEGDVRAAIRARSA